MPGIFQNDRWKQIKNYETLEFLYKIIFNQIDFDKI